MALLPLKRDFIDHLSALQAKSSIERAGFPFSPRGARNVDHFVHLWHLADNPVAPVFVRFWTKADKVEFWPSEFCPLMIQSGHAADYQVHHFARMRRHKHQ
jgi:hypothetical protein